MQVVNNKVEINPNGDNVDLVRWRRNIQVFLVDHSESRVEVIGDLTASVNVSASAFYGNIDIAQPGGGTYYPVFSNTLNGEATLGVDASMAYNNALDTLYIPNVTSVRLDKFSQCLRRPPRHGRHHGTATPDKCSTSWRQDWRDVCDGLCGQRTQISPHDEDGEWQYYSRNEDGQSRSHSYGK